MKWGGAGGGEKVIIQKQILRVNVSRMCLSICNSEDGNQVTDNIATAIQYDRQRRANLGEQYQIDFFTSLWTLPPSLWPRSRQTL